jgi:hypothetical protein
MSNTLSQGVCEAVARDFLKDSVDLTETQHEGVLYQIEGPLSSVRTERDNGNVSLLSGVLAADLIGGITFALAQQGEIPIETATPQNVARICFALGQLTAVSE